MKLVRKTALATLCVALFSGLSANAAVAPPAPTLLTSDPAAGAKLDTAPGSITITFEQPLDAAYSLMEVYDQCGNRVDASNLSVTLSQMTIDLAKSPRGHYKVFYIAKAYPKGATGETSGYLKFDVAKGKACKKGRR